jgi:Rrf2 family protein
MLTMKAKYALRALCALVEVQPEQLQARQIAIAADVPEKFLETILVELRKAGIIVSRRGVQGGHMLARPAEQIMVGEIIRTIDGPLAPIRCASVTAYRACDDCPEPAVCSLRALMGDVRDAMSDVVDRRSLQQLVVDARRLQRKKKPAIGRAGQKPETKSD